MTAFGLLTNVKKDRRPEEEILGESELDVLGHQPYFGTSGVSVHGAGGQASPILAWPLLPLLDPQAHQRSFFSLHAFESGLEAPSAPGPE